MTPGQRTLVFISPGFITPLLGDKVDEIIEKAVRSNVTINALDARGLYAIEPWTKSASRVASTPPGPAGIHLFQPPVNRPTIGVGELADATGGTYFHEQQRSGRGFAAWPRPRSILRPRLLAPEPETRWQLSQAESRAPGPAGIYLPGAPGILRAQARADPAEEDKQEIEEALFSQDELHDIPIELHTQFFKSSDEAPSSRSSPMWT